MNTSAAPYPRTRNPIVVYLMSRTQQLYLIAHASSTWPLHFCHHSFWTFHKVVHINVTMCIRALFPKSATNLGLMNKHYFFLSRNTIERKVKDQKSPLLKTHAHAKNLGAPHSGDVTCLPEHIMAQRWRSVHAMPAPLLQQRHSQSTSPAASQHRPQR